MGAWEKKIGRKEHMQKLNEITLKKLEIYSKINDNPKDAVRVAF